MNNVAEIKSQLSEAQNLLHSIGCDYSHPAHDARHPAHQQSISAISALQRQVEKLQTAMAIEDKLKNALSESKNGAS